MNLFDELQHLIREYVAGHLAFDVLYRWVAGHVQEIDVSGDELLQALADEVWILSSEWAGGARDEAEVRNELARLVPAVTR